MRPIESWNSTSPENSALLVGDRVADMPGRVARREDHVDLEAGELELLAAGDEVVGLVGLERPEAGPRHERS